MISMQHVEKMEKSVQCTIFDKSGKMKKGKNNIKHQRNILALVVIVAVVAQITKDGKLFQDH